jgi:Spy/CpxP family protein refolding chaperone
MKAMRIGIFALGISLLVLSTAKSQPQGMHGDSAPPGRFGPMSEKMKASFENLRLLKLMEALELTEEQSEKFVPLFYQHRKKMQELGEEKQAVVEKLDSMLQAENAEQQILELIAELDKLNQRVEAERVSFQDEAGQMLTVYQQGRMALFQEHFARRVLESLREFRRHGRQGP